MGIYHKLRKRLDRAGIRPSTRRGQNFLLDSNQLGFIVDSAGVKPEDVVLEVGPGTGFLTRQLAKTGCLVLAVELDHGLLPLAREETQSFPNVIYLQGDILSGKNHVNPEVLAKLDELLRLKSGMVGQGGDIRPGLKCVSNLPYSAGTPFTMNLLNSPLPWQTGVFLLQLEVAERMVAPPGGGQFGTLSISCALAARTEILRVVSPRCFWPSPKVDSAVVKLDFLSVGERLAIPWEALRRITNAVFGSRRKILRNALKGLDLQGNVDNRLSEWGIAPDCRGETLTPHQFLQLAVWLRDGENLAADRKNG